MMVVRLLIAIVLAAVCVSDVQAFGSRFTRPRFTGSIRRVRGGGRYGMYRRSLQMRQKFQQQMMQQQMRIAAQEKAEAEAAEKRRHEKLEAAAAANREIKQKEKERGERARRRSAESAGSAGSSKFRRETVKSSGTNAPAAAAKRGKHPADDTPESAPAEKSDSPKK